MSSFLTSGSTPSTSTLWSDRTYSSPPKTITSSSTSPSTSRRSSSRRSSPSSPEDNSFFGPPSYDYSCTCSYGYPNFTFSTGSVRAYEDSRWNSGLSTHHWNHRSIRLSSSSRTLLRNGGVGKVGPFPKHLFEDPRDFTDVTKGRITFHPRGKRTLQYPSHLVSVECSPPRRGFLVSGIRPVEEVKRVGVNNPEDKKDPMYGFSSWFIYFSLLKQVSSIHDYSLSPNPFSSQ